eukprot:TRINITY_DN339_c0_g1_i3.p1 TRINITY_DN339_c0_g1~~TRINITY_DN339_c0_g1_i3.p1  ORF type:complete len:359 (-),score=39.70 TRINITY_DN339_c0_g1_i3:405-1481(-)
MAVAAAAAAAASAAVAVVLVAWFQADLPALWEWCFCVHFEAALSLLAFFVVGVALATVVWRNVTWLRTADFVTQVIPTLSFLGGVLTVLLAALLSVWHDQCRVPWTVAPFLEPPSITTTYVPHLAAEVALNEALSPYVSHYYLVQGPHGSGKSTVAKHLCGASTGDFGLRLAAKLQFTFDEEVSFLHYIDPRSQPKPENALSRTLDMLEKTAAGLGRKLGRRGTLMIDETAWLLRDHPADMIVLQDFAKVCADSALLRVVFIGSEGTVPLFFRGRSAASHMTIVDFADFTRAESVQFLRAKSGGSIGDEMADAIFNVTDGRASLLDDAAQVASSGFEGVHGFETLTPAEEVRSHEIVC